MFQDNIINKVYNVDDGTPGLRINNCSRSSFINNDFNGNNKAIEIFGNSAGNLYCCNTSLSTSISSISFHDNNFCDFRNNKMYALNLSALGNIGIQTLPGNLWQDDNGDNDGTFAMIQGDFNRAVDNRIPFNPQQSNSKPDDFQPVAIENNWFTENNEILSNCTNNPMCQDEFDPNGTGNGTGGSGGNSTGIPVPPIGDPPKPVCEKIMANYYNFINYAGNSGYPYPDQMEWNLNQYLQYYIDYYGQSFFDSCIGDSVVWVTTDVEEWFDGEKDKNGIFDIDPILEEQLEELSELSDSLNNEIYMLVDSTGYTEDTITLQILYDELAQVNDVISILSDSVKTMVRQKALDFLTTISTLPETYGFLVKRKIVWEAEIKSFLFGKDSVSQQNWDILRSIAVACPVEYGKAVSEAQGLLSYYWSEEYEMNYASCQSVNPRTRNESHSRNSALIYPNPGSGTFYISVPKQYQFGTLTIRNIQGTIMNRLELTGQNELSIDLTSNQAGLYLYELENGIETKLFGKIILVD